MKKITRKEFYLCRDSEKQGGYAQFSKLKPKSSCITNEIEGISYYIDGMCNNAIHISEDMREEWNIPFGKCMKVRVTVTVLEDDIQIPNV